MFHPSRGVRCLYVRDRHDNPVGLIMTRVSPDGQEHMGWSLCKRKEDTFRKIDAKLTAEDRLVPIPSVVLGPELRKTPMNCALMALSQDVNVPHTISSGARRELARRQP